MNVVAYNAIRNVLFRNKTIDNNRLKHEKSSNSKPEAYMMLTTKMRSDQNIGDNVSIDSRSTDVGLAPGCGRKITGHRHPKVMPRTKCQENTRAVYRLWRTHLRPH